MIRNLYEILMALLLMFRAIGCSENPAEPVTGELTLEDGFGGYPASPEAPVFGKRNYCWKRKDAGRSSFHGRQPLRE